VTCRKPRNRNSGGAGRPTGPAKESSLSERDRSHWSPIRCRRANFCPSHLNLAHDPDENRIQVNQFLNQSKNLSFLRTDLEPLIELEWSVLFQHSSTERPAGRPCQPLRTALKRPPQRGFLGAAGQQHRSTTPRSEFVVGGESRGLDGIFEIVRVAR
jgi:hypothetical protein